MVEVHFFWEKKKENIIKKWEGIRSHRYGALKVAGLGNLFRQRPLWHTTQIRRQQTRGGHHKYATENLLQIMHFVKRGHKCSTVCNIRWSCRWEFTSPHLESGFFFYHVQTAIFLSRLAVLSCQLRTPLCNSGNNKFEWLILKISHSSWWSLKLWTLISDFKNYGHCSSGRTGPSLWVTDPA